MYERMIADEEKEGSLGKGGLTLTLSTGGGTKGGCNRAGVPGFYILFDLRFERLVEGFECYF